MKYNENNIVGLKFHHKDDSRIGIDKIIYSIENKNSSDVGCRVTWNNDGWGNYTIPSIVSYLNNGTWLPIEDEEEVW